MTEPPLERAVLRIRDASGSTVGVGFLVTERLAVTCAHVVRLGLGLAPTEAPGEGAVVRTELTFADHELADGGTRDRGHSVPASVAHWLPEEPSGGGQDIAVLRLHDPAPAGRPAPLAELSRDSWGHPVRTFGFPSQRGGGVWHAGVLRGRQANGWFQFERDPASAYPISRGFSGAPVWDEALGAVIGMVIAADPRHPVGFLIPVRDLAAVSPELRQAVAPPCPFPGLSPFQSGQSPFFFGRERESAEIAELVDQNPIVTVLGASGCGKSSVVRAGVVPRLRGAGHRVVAVRAAFLESLAAELTRLQQPELSGSRLRDETRKIRTDLLTGRLPDVVAEATGGGGDRMLVLVIDQLEEALSLAGEASDGLLAALFRTARPIPGLRVLTTLRADALDAVGEHPSLRHALRRKSYLLPPMTSEQLHEVVVRPIDETRSVAYESRLERHILDDAGDSPGVLPLLAFTLQHLWENRRSGLLTHEAYAQLGGVRGALRERADAAWRRCVAADMEPAARRLLTRLVQVSGGTPQATFAVRRTALRAEVGEDEWRAAELLAGERLLVLGTDTENGEIQEPEGTRGTGETAELAHEALISSWPQLTRWVESDREFLGWRDQLRHQQDRWAHQGEPDDLLPTATDLAAGATWEKERRGDLTATDLRFLERGRKRVRARTRRRRHLFAAFSLVLALASTLASLFVYQSGVSETRSREAESRSLAAASLDLQESDPSLSIMLALEAYQRSPTEMARDALMQNHLAHQGTEWVMSGSLGDNKGMAASRDGDVVLATSVGGRATVYVRDGEGQAAQEHLPWQGNYALQPFVTPDGERVGYVGDDRLVWHDVRDPGADPDRGLVGEAHVIPLPESLGLRDVSFPQQLATAAPGGREVIVAADGRLVVVDLLTEDVTQWPLATREELWFHAVWPGPAGESALVLVSEPEQDVSLSLDDAYAANEYWLVSMDLTSGSMRTLAEGIDYAGVSGDGGTAVVCGGNFAENSDYQVLDTTTGGELTTLRPERSCGPIALDHAGQYVTLGVSDWMTYALSANGDATRLPGISATPITDEADSDVYHRLLESEGTLYLLIRSSNGLALIEQPTSDERPVTVGAVGLTRDGGDIVGYSGDGQQLYLYDSLTGRPAVTTDREGATSSPEPGDPLYVSPGGTLLADRMAPERIVIRDTTTLQQVSVIDVAPLPEATPLERSTDDLAKDLVYYFLDDDQLVTQSGTVVEMWDTRSGERVERLDLATLGLLDDVEQPTNYPVTIGPYPRDGHIAVVNGTSDVRVVDLRAGEEIDELRVDTGEDVLGVGFDEDAEHMVLIRQGAVWEMWDLDARDRVFGPMPSVCGACDASDVLRWGFLEDGGFYIASGSRVDRYEPDQGYPVESYTFGRPGQYFDVSTDGMTVLYSPESTYSQPIWEVHLDRPDEWAEALCEVIGWREITESEQGGSTADLLSGAVCEQ